MGMGNWNITIRGVGCHHNNRADVKDANKAAATFVRKLKADGHHIVAASFTHGGEDDLQDEGKYPPPPVEGGEPDGG
jgi:hypothetical protein